MIGPPEEATDAMIDAFVEIRRAAGLPVEPAEVGAVMPPIAISVRQRSLRGVLSTEIAVYRFAATRHADTKLILYRSPGKCHAS